MMLEGDNYGSYSHALAGAPPKKTSEKSALEIQKEIEFKTPEKQTVSQSEAQVKFGIKPTFYDPIPAIIAEADGYAATLITAGALKQADYDTQKATAMGAAWTVESATAFRDAVKKALDNYVAGKDKGGMGWLLPVGIAAAAFLALRD